ncbi:FAD-dependent oxidoreductase [Thiohalorhabdus methylotrophus]|uniref:FAD-dependent oxidoreductase n=1 Tax=Thiohalorhabdus methylotrophus TaxID=3242694 RepID=A0ABV4TVG4_9GAMM
MGQFDSLFQPLTIKNVTIRNRIMSTAHAEVYAEDGMPGERYRLYHVEKARGGIGLTMCGGSSSVSIDNPSQWWSSVDVSSDRVIPYFRELTGAVHDHGAAMMIQLTHKGRRNRWDGGDWPHLLSPSGGPEPLHKADSKAMEAEDFERVIRDYAEAVRRARDGGFDGVEISAAHEHLIDQFWSPRSNRRTDAYGGSLENRMRFGLEVFAEIRRVVGNDFVVGMRMPGDELHPDGLDQADLRAIAVRYAGTGMVDFLNVMGSAGDTYATIPNVVPSMAFPPQPFVHLASGIKAEVDVPVIHAQNIKDPASAARLIDEGHVDLVGMTRAHIADPHFVNKVRDGQTDRIRQCVGANNCINRMYDGLDVLCIQNAATGREQTMPHAVRKAPIRRQVVVVGGGPAGMEAARVCAERGHDVTLFEKGPRLGGQLDLAARAPARESLAGITRWFELELKRLNVEIALNTEADAPRIRDLRPDLVLLATGGVPDLDAEPGWRAAEGMVASVHDILGGAVAPEKNVLVYDVPGRYAGVTVADHLAERGALVELVSPDPAVGSDVGGTTQPVYLQRLYEKDVVLTPSYTLQEVYPEGDQRIAVLANEYTGSQEERAVDQVVVDNGTRPAHDLYFALKDKSRNRGQVDLHALFAAESQPEPEGPGDFTLYRFGDCVSGRDIHGAIYDALRLCKAL